MGKPRPFSLFYKITFGTLAVISTLSTLAIVVTKIEAYWKEKKLTNNINIMINNIQGQPQQNLNTKKYNDPIISTVLLVVRAFVFIGSFIFFFKLFNVNSTVSDHIKNLYYGLALKIIFKCAVPVCITYFYHKGKGLYDRLPIRVSWKQTSHLDVHKQTDALASIATR